MPKILLFSLLMGLFSSISLQAQRYRDPGDYYRELSSQNRRLQMKKMRYLESVLTNADPRRTDRYRELVVEQIDKSLQELRRVGSYQGDSVVLKEYLRGYEMQQEAFKELFGRAEELGDSRFTNYDSLKRYYDHFNEAELTMNEGDYILSEANDYFFNTYTFQPRRSNDLDEQLRKLDELSVYLRDVNMAFYRVDAVLHEFFTAVEEKEVDSLKENVVQLRRAVKTSQEEAQNLGEFQGEDDAIDFLKDYLEEIQDNIDDTFRPLAQKFSNQFLADDDYQDAKKELGKLEEWHQEERSAFLEDQQEMVEDFLED